MDDDERYANIREILGRLIGCKVVDITQHDAEEFQETRQSRVELHFDNGETLRFLIDDEGFDYETTEESGEES